MSGVKCTLFFSFAFCLPIFASPSGDSCSESTFPISAVSEHLAPSLWWCTTTSHIHPFLFPLISSLSLFFSRIFVSLAFLPLPTFPFSSAASPQPTQLTQIPPISVEYSSASIPLVQTSIPTNANRAF